MSNRECRSADRYLVTCVGDFAVQHAMMPSEAYLFLEKHHGLDFLSECYDVEHSQSIQTAVDDMTEVCCRHV